MLVVILSICALMLAAPSPVFAEDEISKIASDVVERVDDLQNLAVEAIPINDFI